MLAPWKKSYDQPRQHITKQRYYFAPKVHLVKAMVLPVVMCGCGSWKRRRLSSKDWNFWTVMLEKTLESPLDCKEIKPVNPKGNHSWIFTGRTDVKAEAPILWPPNVKSWLIGKDPDAGKDWRQKEKGTTEDDTTGWHHWFSRRVWASSGKAEDREAWHVAVYGGLKELDMTEWLNNNNKFFLESKPIFSVIFTL